MLIVFTNVKIIDSKHVRHIFKTFRDDGRNTNYKDNLKWKVHILHVYDNYIILFCIIM